MATFRINVVVDPRRATQGTKKVERSLARVENRATSLRRTLGLTFTALAGGAIIFSAIRSMAKFEESIATARAVTGATAKEFENLRDRALELGITTRFSATQAADALVLLARAGFSVDESLTAVGDTLRLAQAGGIGLAEAADITASALRGFNLTAKQTADVTDVLTVVTNNANSNISEMGQALKFVAPIAQGLGKDIRETSAALGVLSDAGLKATLAGTGLRRVFAELESPGRELNTLLREAGLAAEDVAPSQNKLIDILNKLKRAGIDTGLALEIFGQRGGPAFQVLVSNTDRLALLNEKLEDTAGATKKVADILDDTLFGALKDAGSAVNGLVLALGKAGASDVLIGILSGITEAVRFMAANVEILNAVLIGLAVAGVAKLSVVLLTKFIPSISAASLATVLFRGNIIAMAATWVKSAATIAATNPFIVLTVAVSAAGFAASAYFRELENIRQIMVEVNAETAKLTHESALLGSTMRELNIINRAVEKQNKRGVGSSDSQRAAIERLNKRLDELKGTIRKKADAQKEANDREARGAEITDALIERLERRNAIAKALGQTQQDLAKFQEELNKLEEQGGIPSAKEKERIRNLIKENDAFARQRKLFDDIRGPQNEFVQNQKALGALLERGAITAGEFAVKMQELRDALAPTDVKKQLNALEILEQENKALGERIRQGDFVADAIALENKLRKGGTKITDDVQARIAKGIILRNEQAAATKKQADEEARLKRIQNQEDRSLDRLERRIKSQEALNKEAGRLKVLFDQNRLSADEFGTAMENVQLKGLEASNKLEDGFTRAFIKIKQEAEDLAAVGEAVVNVFADNATEALVKFAETGQFKFKEFANAILQDLIRIIARLLIVQALSAAFGGGGGANLPLPGVIGPQPRQKGGTVQPARSFVVGENGPELFVPDRTGSIVPNQKDQQAAPPQVNVQVVNVKSEEEVPQAINDGLADEAIINALARNKDRVNSVIA